MKYQISKLYKLNCRKTSVKCLFKTLLQGTKCLQRTREICQLFNLVTLVRLPYFLEKFAVQNFPHLWYWGVSTVRKRTTRKEKKRKEKKRKEKEKKS